MYVPVFQNRVVKNDVVYSDTVLNPKELGKNIRVSYLSDVEDCSLNLCLETIFNSNPNTIFHTIQYSKNKKEVSFFTEISINYINKRSKT